MPVRATHCDSESPTMIEIINDSKEAVTETKATKVDEE